MQSDELHNKNQLDFSMWLWLLMFIKLRLQNFKLVDVYLTCWLSNAHKKMMCDYDWCCCCFPLLYHSTRINSTQAQYILVWSCLCLQLRLETKTSFPGPQHCSPVCQCIGPEAELKIGFSGMEMLTIITLSWVIGYAMILKLITTLYIRPLYSIHS